MTPFNNYISTFFNSRWDPEEYGNLTRLELPPSQLWTPDVFLFNDATGQFSQDLKRDNPMLVVSNEGHVRWIPPLVVKYNLLILTLSLNIFYTRSMCDIASQKTQEIVTCELKFGSWVYNAGQLDLINVKLFINALNIPFECN